MYAKGNDIKEDMERMLIKDVQTAVGDMVELIKTYRSKRKISQVIVSTMFRRRMEEAEAVIDRAISDLKVMILALCNASARAEHKTPFFFSNMEPGK